MNQQMNKVDEFNVADALIGMAVPSNKDDENVAGLYDKRRNVKFPVKLMQILDDESYHHIISWTPDGKAFAVLKPTILEQKVLPTVFDNKQNGTSKFKSFLRKLYRWGFLKKFHQSDDYTYYHKAFQRGNLALCLTITRLPNVKKPTPNKSNSNSIDPHANSSAATAAAAVAAAGLTGATGSLSMANHPSLGGAAAGLAAAAVQSDAAIINALKQKLLLNELMRATAMNAATSKAGGGNHDATAAAAAAATAASSAPSPLAATSLPALQALQLSALARSQQNFNNNPLASLGLADRLLQNSALHNQQQHQQSLNELLLAGSLRGGIGGGSNLNAMSGLLGNSLFNPATAAALTQARINSLDLANSHFLGGGGGTATTTNPQFGAGVANSNDALFNSGLGTAAGAIGGLDEAKKKLLLASLAGASGGTPQQSPTPTPQPASPTEQQQQHHHQHQNEQRRQQQSPSSQQQQSQSPRQSVGGKTSSSSAVVPGQEASKSASTTNSTHTQIMNGALNDLMKRQQLLETLEANLSQAGQVASLGGGSNMFLGI